MANRYCNLTPSKKISEDFGNITKGFDGVQSDMDAKSGNAFASVNGVDAGQVNDTLTLEGATGITITTNQASKKVIITATGTSTPGAHGSSHDHDGSDPIPDLIQAQADISAINDKLDAAADQSAAAHYGQNYLLTDQASPLDYVIKGRTLVNLLGEDGNCESLTGWQKSQVTVDSTHVKYSSNAFKVSSTTGDTYAYKDYDAVDADKYYIASVYVYVTRVNSSGNVPLLSVYDKETFSNAVTMTADPNKLNQWQQLYVKFTGKEGVRLLMGRFAGNDSFDAWFDGARIYEVSAADYAAIGTTITESTTPSIDDVWPYVDGVKHLSGVGVTLAGKNLLPPFTEWTPHSSAQLLGPYSFSIQGATGSTLGSSVTVSVIPGQTYTLTNNSADDNGRSAVTGNISGSILSASSDAIRTFSSGSNTSVTITLDKTTAETGVVIFSNWQLELGSAATDFEPQNNDYAYVDTKLASNVDGSVADTFDSRLGTVTRRIKPDVALNGSLPYTFNSDGSGFKTINLPLSGHMFTDGSVYKLSKYDGKIIPYSVDAFTSGDVSRIFNTGMYISIADSDSGWGEPYSPSSTEVAAYFWGWRMNNGTFGTPYNGTGTKTWIPLNATSNTGAVTTVPTTASSAITSGAYDYYRLSYQLATPAEEAVVPEGALSSHNGGNQYEVLSGIAVREEATPQLDNVTHTDTYQINYLPLPGSYLIYRAGRINAVYKNGVKDNKWTIRNGLTDTSAFGTARAFIPVADYDPDAEYTVTYQALDRYSLTTYPVDLTLYYSTNLKTVVDTLVQDMADVETMASVNTRAIAELYKLYKSLGG